MSESTTDQDRIEQDLAQTRARMDGRLSALQERLSPGQILDDLMAYFRGSEGGDFARNLMTSVRNNPMPAAVTGIGLAWLMASNPYPRPAAEGSSATPAEPRAIPPGVTSPATWASENEFDRHIRGVEDSVVRTSDETDSAFSGRLNDARATALGLVRGAQDTAETYGQRVRDALAEARRTATGAAQALGGKASDTAKQLTDAMGGAGDQLARGGQAAQQMAGDLLANITENPILLGAIGLTVGAMLGALVPQSDQEQAALGDMGRRAREGIGDLAQEAVDRGATVARQVVDAGSESMTGQGLAGKTAGHFVDETLKGNLASSVGEIAKDVLRAGDAALRKEGLHQAQPGDGSASGAASEGGPDHSGSPGRSDSR